MLGHLFWSREFSKKFIDILERQFDDENTEDKLWETIFIEHIDELLMKIKNMILILFLNLIH